MNPIRQIVLALVFLQAMAYAQYNDGAANAPAGVAPQHPTWLSSYAKRPPWNVAGVDYGVGYPAGTVLKDPATINISGVDTDLGAHRIWVNTSNVTLNGYDFTGWELIIGARGTAGNTTIKNSYFEGGITAGWNNVTNLYVGYCVIDGMNTTDFLLSLQATGLTAEYNWFKNSASDFISIAAGGGAVTIRYNVMEENGTPGTHPDWLQQLGSSFTTTTVMYNTAYKSTTGQGTQGFMVEGTQTGEIGYNIMVARGAGASYVTSISATISGSVHDNYVDLTNAYGFYYAGSDPNVTQCGNYSLVTGQRLSGESACASRITDITSPAVAIKLTVLADPATGKVMFQFPGKPVSGIAILDAQGRLVRQLEGLVWDGTDVQGRRVPAGVYLYRLTADGVTQCGKIVKYN